MNRETKVLPYKHYRFTFKGVKKTGKCRVCGRVVAVYPMGGDWLNAVYPVNHKDPFTKSVCDERNLEVLEILNPKEAK